MDSSEQLRFMLVMAAVDGGLAAEELQLLADRARQWGISSDQFFQIVENAAHGDVTLRIPETEFDRNKLLMDVIRMMGADGQLHPAERRLFALVAVKMGIDSDELNRIIDATLKATP